MPHYKVIEKSTGIKVFDYNNEVPVELDGMGFATHDHIPWYPEIITVETPVVKHAGIPAFDFLRRFSRSERIAIRVARISDPTLDDFFSLLDKADTVHFDDPDLIGGMAYLVYKEFLTTDRRNTIMEIT